MVNKRIDLRFSGVGGQGVILAGAILAEAAVLFDHKFAIQSPTYTAQVRGGATKVDVVISPERINYPQTREIHFFMSVAQNAYDRFYGHRRIQFLPDPTGRRTSDRRADGRYFRRVSGRKPDRGRIQGDQTPGKTDIEYNGCRICILHCHAGTGWAPRVQ